MVSETSDRTLSNDDDHDDNSSAKRPSKTSNKSKADKNKAVTEYGLDRVNDQSLGLFDYLRIGEMIPICTAYGVHDANASNQIV